MNGNTCISCFAKVEIKRVTLEVLAKKYELTPTQISIWKSLALKNFGNQCQLLTQTRCSFYYISSGESEENLAIMRKLDEQYFSTSFYGMLRITALLILSGF